MMRKGKEQVHEQALELHSHGNVVGEDLACSHCSQTWRMVPARSSPWRAKGEVLPNRKREQRDAKGIPSQSKEIHVSRVGRAHSSQAKASWAFPDLPLLRAFRELPFNAVAYQGPSMVLRPAERSSPWHSSSASMGVSSAGSASPPHGCSQRQRRHSQDVGNGPGFVRM